MDTLGMILRIVMIILIANPVIGLIANEK